MARNPNQNVWSYTPPHRGAMLDGGSPQAMANDNSVSGGWADRSSIGSSTSGFEYVEEAKFDGNAYVRRDGTWVTLYSGDETFQELTDRVEVLEEEVRKLIETVANLDAQSDGWDDARVVAIEEQQSAMLAGTVTFDKISSSGAMTAYTSASEET